MTGKRLKSLILPQTAPEEERPPGDLPSKSYLSYIFKKNRNSACNNISENESESLLNNLCKHYTVRDKVHLKNSNQFRMRGIQSVCQGVSEAKAYSQ